MTGRSGDSMPVDPQAANLEVPPGLIRGAFSNHDESIRSACWLIDHLCDHLGLQDLGQTEMLDVGCGVKFTQAFLNLCLPIKRYVGCDVSEDLIAHLQTNVEDERFEYVHLPAHNELYNPKGLPLEDINELPTIRGTFDLITLFSVFTHLNPTDFRAMLNLLRGYATPRTTLFFSLYLDELTDGGYGLIDELSRALDESKDDVAEAVAENMDAASGTRHIEPFRDLNPARPLLWALYSESYARELIEGTGWRVITLSQPGPYIQHHFVCRLD